MSYSAPRSKHRRLLFPLLLLVGMVAEGCAIGAEQTGTAGRSEPILGGTLDHTSVSVVRILRDGQPHCTGTWVGQRTILTAAHCLKDAVTRYTVEFVANLGTAADPAITRVAYPVQSATRHPSFNTTDDTGTDLGIIRLATVPTLPVPNPAPAGSPPPFEPSTLSALPFEAIPAVAAPAYEASPTRVSIVGFGSTEFGQPQPAGLRYTADKWLSRRTATHIEMSCLGFEPCTHFGDSGGPAFATYETERLLGGVTSGGTIACGYAVMAFDTRVDDPSVASWILTTAGNDVRYYAPRLVAKDVTGVTFVNGTLNGRVNVETQSLTSWATGRELYTYFSGTTTANQFSGRVFEGGVVLVFPPGSSTTAATIDLQLQAPNGTAFTRRVYVPAVPSSTRTVSLAVGVDGSTFHTDPQHDGWTAGSERLSLRAALHPTHVARRAPSADEGAQTVSDCGFVCGSGYNAGIVYCE